MMDIELIILSFVMAEKKRQARTNMKGKEKSRTEEDPMDGGASGAEAEGADSFAFGEL